MDFGRNLMRSGEDFGGVILQRNRVFVHDGILVSGFSIQPYNYFDKFTIWNGFEGLWSYFEGEIW